MKCGSKWIGHEEKMTDVNIATQLLIDAYDDGFDCALVISGDSDVGAAGQSNPPAISEETRRRRFFHRTGIRRLQRMRVTTRFKSAAPTWRQAS